MADIPGTVELSQKFNLPCFKVFIICDGNKAAVTACGPLYFSNVVFHAFICSFVPAQKNI